MLTLKFGARHFIEYEYFVKILISRACRSVAAAFLVSGIFYMPPAVAVENSLSVEAFARELDVPLMRISPDGSKLATAISNGYQTRLALFDVAAEDFIPMAFPLHEVTAVEWIDDAELLAVAEDAFDASQVYRVNVKTNKVTQLTQFSNNDGRSLFPQVRLFPSYSFAKGTAGIWRSFYRSGAELYDLNLSDNALKREMTFNHPLDMVFPDAESDVRMMEEWRSDTYKVTFREGDEGTSKILFSGSQSDKSQMHPIVKIPHAASMYVTVSDEDRIRLRLYDIEANQAGPVVLSDDKYDVEATPLILPFSGEVVGFRYERDKPHVEYLDAQIKAMMPGIDKALPGRVNTIEGASVDRSVMVILSEGDRQPGEYLLYFPKQKKLLKILSRADWLPEDELGKSQVVHFNARDGLPVEAYLTLPAHAVAGAPLVVLPHGGPHVRDEWGYDLFAQFLASRGYAVIQPNYRISTGYGKAFYEKGLGQVGYAIEDDIFDALAWAQKRGYGSDGNACIMGASFGGYAAMRAATQEPKAFKCVIAIAGFYDVIALLNQDKDRAFYSTMKQIYGDPVTERQRLIDASPIHFISDVQAPVLVIHGKLDDRVNFTQAEELVRQLTAQKKEFETLLRPDEGHSFHKELNREKMLDAIGRFLDKHLPIAAAPQ